MIHIRYYNIKINKINTYKILYILYNYTCIHVYMHNICKLIHTHIYIYIYIYNKYYYNNHGHWEMAL